MILALDIGTSSCRAAIFEVDGTRLPNSLAQRIYRLETDADGKAILDPFELLTALQQCIDSALMCTDRPVLGVGMSCFWHSLLGVDPQGTPLTPILTWADSRCRADAEALRREVSEEEIHQETGCMVRASFWPAKLRWMKRVDEATFERVARWISPAEWVQWQITGHPSCAIGMATGTGLFDPTRQTWSERVLNLCGINEDHLLPLSDEAISWQGRAWVPGIGDGAASNLGSGATRPGFGAINIGTSAAMRVMMGGATARSPFGLFCYRVDSDRFLKGGAISNAGNLHAWCLAQLQVPNAECLERELAARPLPQHGLTVLPFWTAERAPRWNEDDRGTIAGFTHATTAVDLVQALQEASFLRLRAILNAVRQAGMIHPVRWIVAGGILHSPSALQRLANVLGESVTINGDPEASLRGAAVFALERLGSTPSDLPLAAAIEPIAEAHEAYTREFESQRKLEDLLAT